MGWKEMAWAADDAQVPLDPNGTVSSPCRMVLIYVAKSVTARSNFYRGTTYLVEKTGFSERTVQAALDRLEEFGLIRKLREATPRKAAVYTLALPPRGATIAGWGAAIAPESNRDVTEKSTYGAPHALGVAQMEIPMAAPGSLRFDDEEEPSARLPRQRRRVEIDDHEGQAVGKFDDEPSAREKPRPNFGWGGISYRFGKRLTEMGLKKNHNEDAFRSALRNRAEKTGVSMDDVEVMVDIFFTDRKYLRKANVPWTFFITCFDELYERAKRSGEIAVQHESISDDEFEALSRRLA